MHFVAALDRIAGHALRAGLQENVVTGAADGYYRMTGKPAATLLHCGPGLANGLANLHNARRARSGIVNVVGDQATYHRPLDAPLTADAEGWARGVSGFVRTTASAERGRARRRRGGRRGRAHRARPDRDADPAERRIVERRRRGRASRCRCRRRDGRPARGSQAGARAAREAERAAAARRRGRARALRSASPGGSRR